MSLLFDASALLNIIKLHGDDVYRILKSNLTLSLTKYEIGNVLWKEALLLRRISIGEALEAIQLLENILKVMNIINPRSSDLVLKLAYELQITYYDSSYIVSAAENNAKLVTDDTKLIEKIQERKDIINDVLKKEVEVFSSNKIP